MDPEGFQLRIVVFTDGSYGLRILENLRQCAPDGWVINHLEIPGGLPNMVEDPEEYVDRLGLDGSWDLALYMGESPSAFSLLPSVVERLPVKAVIAPVDDYDWLPLGLERQIKDEVEEKGVSIVFPRTFCALALVGNPEIDEFASHFGAPRLKVRVEDKEVTHVDVLRGAPCGSTHYMADGLPGTAVGEAGARAGTLVQIFPCLASRSVDRYFGDAPIHVAGQIAQRAVEKALES